MKTRNNFNEERGLKIKNNNKQRKTKMYDNIDEEYKTEINDNDYQRKKENFKKERDQTNDFYSVHDDVDCLICLYLYHQLLK